MRFTMYSSYTFDQYVFHSLIGILMFTMQDYIIFCTIQNYLNHFISVLFFSAFANAAAPLSPM